MSDTHSLTPSLLKYESFICVNGAFYGLCARALNPLSRLFPADAGLHSSSDADGSGLNVSSLTSASSLLPQGYKPESILYII